MISVVIPLYNKEQIIGKSLQSVLSQDYDDFEVVIVNDGSTDRSAEIVKGIDDSRIRLIEQENGGPSKARNTGVMHAKGDWIVFLDADDELVDNALQMMDSEISNYPNADLIDFNGYIQIENRKFLRYHPITGKVKNPLRSFYYRHITPGCGHSIFKTTFVRKHPYDERIRRFEDFEILLRMLPNANVFSSQSITDIHNMNYAEASNARKDIMEDYMGYLDIKKGSFWHKMCSYRLFLEERDHYSMECRKRYPLLYYRYDLMIICRVLSFANKFYK